MFVQFMPLLHSRLHSAMYFKGLPKSVQNHIHDALLMLCQYPKFYRKIAARNTWYEARRVTLQNTW